MTIKGDEAEQVGMGLLDLSFLSHCRRGKTTGQEHRTKQGKRSRRATKELHNKKERATGSPERVSNERESYRVEEARAM